MSEPKSFASLSPSLLARKGAARPAMRPQLHPMHHFHEATARQLEEDLGWNDMGHDDHVAAAAKPEPQEAPATRLTAGAPVARLEARVSQEGALDEQAQPEAEIVALGDMQPASPQVPEVVRQQAQIAKTIAKGASRSARARKPALSSGRRAAFTLRLDAERHLKLRLACTIDNRSAQQIVTDALDRLIAEMPEIEALAAQVKKHN